jgi:stress response protein SCP2
LLSPIEDFWFGSSKASETSKSFADVGDEIRHNIELGNDNLLQARWLRPMAIKLTTGQRITLRKEAPGLTALLCGLGWEITKGRGLKKFFQSDFDLDSAVLCLDENGKVQKGSDVISHLGDNQTGKLIQEEEDEEEDEEEYRHDKEQILVTLPKIPRRVAKLVFVATIYESYPRKQSLGQVHDAYVRLVDLEHEHEIACYDLSDNAYQDKTGVILAEVCRRDGKWQAEAIGEGVKVASLQELVQQRYS